MKKYLALILGVLFVLSFAASAFAIHAEIPAETQSVVATGTTQITLGGEIRTRGWWTSNLFDNTISDKTPDAAWYDERVRLSVDAVVAPGVEGFVQLETTSAFAGDKYEWGTGQDTFTQENGGSHTTTGYKNSSGLLGSNSKPAATFDILQSWIVYSGQGLLGFNSGLKIGHMPLKLAYGEFFDNTQYGDDAIVFFMSPVKGLEIAFLTFKGSEGNRQVNSDDMDAYVGLVTYKWDDKNTVGINYTYLNGPNTISSGTDVDTSTALKLQNLGLHADGNVSGLGYKATVDFQFGSITFPFPQKTDFKGYAVTAGLNYQFNPVNLRASFALGSGGTATDTDIKEFTTFNGNIQNYSFIYEYQHATTAGFNGIVGAAPVDGESAGIANTTYYNIGADFQATKDLKLAADGYYFRATKAPFDGVSKNAGWEVDAKLVYALARNLTYQIDAGYYKEGSFFTSPLTYGSDGKGTTALRHMITLSF